MPAQLLTTLAASATSKQDLRTKVGDAINVLSDFANKRSPQSGFIGDAFKASTTFGATIPSRRKRYRVCFYNPVTGARSPLSSDVIVVGQTAGLVGDWANGVQRRQGGAVWTIPGA
jgi:hypothetical protein